MSKITALNSYHKQIQWRHKTFWNPIFNGSTPKEIGDTIRIRTMRLSPMLSRFIGEEETGKLCAKLEDLANTIYFMKTVQGAKAYLHWWRTKEAKCISNNRVPEDQSKLFESKIWKRK